MVEEEEEVVRVVVEVMVEVVVKVVGPGAGPSSCLLAGSPPAA